MFCRAKYWLCTFVSKWTSQKCVYLTTDDTREFKPHLNFCYINSYRESFYTHLSNWHFSFLALLALSENTFVCIILGQTESSRKEITETRLEVINESRFSFLFCAKTSVRKKWHEIITSQIFSPARKIPTLFSDSQTVPSFWHSTAIGFFGDWYFNDFCPLLVCDN